MKTLLFIFSISIFFYCNSLFAQVAPEIEWQKCLGGYDQDYANCIHQTSDGGYIVAGKSQSNDGDVTGNHYYTNVYYADSFTTEDFWIVKLDAISNIQWQKSLGGSNQEEAFSIQQTSDGGYIVAGASMSSDGDVSFNHTNIWGEPTEDYWVVKLDNNGNIQWEKSFGGSDYDNAYSVQQTSDDGYIISGISYSNDGDVSGNHTDYFGTTEDIWVIKLDASGNLIWQKSLGGSDADGNYGGSIQQTIDNGYIVACTTLSNDGDVSGNHPGPLGVIHYDCWITKLDVSGNIVWQKCLGGSTEDYCFIAKQTSDGGYVVGASTFSDDGDLTENYGYDDFWIVKLDASGNIIWQKIFGGNQYDGISSMQQLTDGGYVVIGATQSNDIDVSGNHGGNDYWVIRLDINGILLWQKCLGGIYWDTPSAIEQTFDGGYILSGISGGLNSGDVSGIHAGTDYWVVKLFSDAATSCSANFYVTPDSLIAHHYWGVNTATGSSPLTYVWSWGDGTYDSIAYPSHTYAVGGFYNICLTIADSTGCTDSICYNYQILKLSEAEKENTISYINIVSTVPTSTQNILEQQPMILFPNPVQSKLYVKLTDENVAIVIYGIHGKTFLLPTTILNTNAELNTSNLPAGFYTLQIINKKTGVSEVAKFVKQ